MANISTYTNYLIKQTLQANRQLLNKWTSYLNNLEQQHTKTPRSALRDIKQGSATRKKHNLRIDSLVYNHGRIHV